MQEILVKLGVNIDGSRQGALSHYIHFTAK